MALWVIGTIGIFLLGTGGFVLATRLFARRRGRIFLEGLGGVVRIGTPCLLPSSPLHLPRKSESESPGGAAGAAAGARGRALIPGTVALTPAGLVWEGLWGRSGAYPFEEIQRLETDDRLSSGRGFLRSKVLRVTATSGSVHEFVLSPGHAWEWRQALGEWAASRGRILNRILLLAWAALASQAVWVLAVDAKETGAPKASIKAPIPVPARTFEILTGQLLAGSYDARMRALLDLRTLLRQQPELIPRLAGLLEQDSPDVRVWAMRTLSSIGAASAPAIPALGRILRGDPDGGCREEAVIALRHLGVEAHQENVVLPWLVQALQDEQSRVRVEAAGAFSYFGWLVVEEHVPALVEAARDKDENVRRVAVNALGEAGGSAAAQTAIPALILALDDPVLGVRFVAAGSLKRIGPAAHAAVPALIHALHDDSELLRVAAIEALQAIGSMAAPASPALIRALQDRRTRSAAAEALAEIGSKGADLAPDILPLVKHEDPEYRAAGIRIVARMGPAAATAVPALVLVLGTDNVYLRQDAARALAAIGPEAAPAIPALLHAATHKDRDLRMAALSALAALPPSADSIPELAGPVGKDPDPNVRWAAVLVLARHASLAPERVIPLLTEALRDKEAIASASADALASLGPPASAAVPALIRRIERDLGRRPCTAYVVALGRIGPSAREAKPILLRLLEQDLDASLVEIAAEALVAIEPARETLVQVFLRRARDRPVAQARLGRVVADTLGPEALELHLLPRSLAQAIDRDDLDAIRGGIRKPANADMLQMALVRAARVGRVGAVRVVLELGADVNAPVGFAWAEALTGKKVGPADLFGASQVFRFLDTPLISAVRAGQLEVVRFLLAAGARGDDIREFAWGPSNHGYWFTDEWTALLVAARDGSAEIVDALIEAGAGVNTATPRYAINPLGAAASAGREAIVARLVKAGADRNRFGPGALLDVAWGREGLAYYSIKGRFWGSSPREVARPPKPQDYARVARALVAWGVSPDAANAQGETALMIAAGIGNVAVVRALLESGADVDATATDGHTALIQTARVRPDLEGVAGLRQVAVTLISARASVNAPDQNGWNALMNAIGARNYELVPILVKGGTDVRHKSRDGTTALSLAQQQESEFYGKEGYPAYKDMVRLLRSASATQ